MDSAWQSVLAGLPILVVHPALTTGLLLGGAAIYAAFAPYRQISAGIPIAAALAH